MIMNTAQNGGGQRIMKVDNLTPHTLTIITGSGAVAISPSGMVARVAVTRDSAGTVTIDRVAVPISRTTYGAVEGLPDPEPDTLYVVSAIVAAAARDRNDLVVPDGLIRDDQGRVIGARGLAFPG